MGKQFAANVKRKRKLALRVFLIGIQSNLYLLRPEHPVEGRLGIAAIDVTTFRLITVTLPFLIPIFIVIFLLEYLAVWINFLI